MEAKEVIENAFKSVWGEEGATQDQRLDYRAIDLTMNLDEYGQVSSEKTGIELRVISHPK